MWLFGRKNRIKKQKRNNKYRKFDLLTQSNGCFSKLGTPSSRKSCQQSIPIDTIYKDGVFRTGRLFSRTWRVSDINYAVVSNDDQLQMFLAHSAILNGLPTDAMAEITVYNRQLHNKVFSNMTTPSDNQNYYKYTQELNGILSDKMAESNNIIHEKYITFATEKKNIEEARTFFTRVGNDLTADFAKITSKVTELGYKDRLRIFNDFFKTGEQSELNFDIKRLWQRVRILKTIFVPTAWNLRKITSKSVTNMQGPYS